MKDKVVAVVGGAGFIGRNVVRELCKKGVRVNVGCRDTESAKFLRSMGDVGQVNFCLLYTSPSPRDKRQSRMPSSA